MEVAAANVAVDGRMNMETYASKSTGSTSSPETMLVEMRELWKEKVPAQCQRLLDILSPWIKSLGKFLEETRKRGGKATAEAQEGGKEGEREGERDGEVGVYKAEIVGMLGMLENLILNAEAIISGGEEALLPRMEEAHRSILFLLDRSSALEHEANLSIARLRAAAATGNAVESRPKLGLLLQNLTGAGAGAGSGSGRGAPTGDHGTEEMDAASVNDERVRASELTGPSAAGPRRKAGSKRDTEERQRRELERTSKSQVVRALIEPLLETPKEIGGGEDELDASSRRALDKFKAQREREKEEGVQLVRTKKETKKIMDLLERKDLASVGHRLGEFDRFLSSIQAPASSAQAAAVARAERKRPSPKSTLTSTAKADPGRRGFGMRQGTSGRERQSENGKKRRRV